MVAANLRQQGLLRPLLQTVDYRRLDPSEKGAISFFLGQVSTKLFADQLLGVPILSRVDEAMRVHGLPARGRRPDFYGYGPLVGTVGVESKGRTGMWNIKLVDGAKRQAQALPKPLGGGAHCAYAHVAYFRRREWRALLADPPRIRRSPAPSLGSVLTAYYQPIVELLLERGPTQVRRGDTEFAVIEMPEADLRLGLRRDLFEVASQASVPERGTHILRLIGGQKTDVGETVERQASADLYTGAALASREADLRRSVGADGVLLEVGENWAPSVMQLEPQERVKGQPPG